MGESVNQCALSPGSHPQYCTVSVNICNTINRSQKWWLNKMLKFLKLISQQHWCFFVFFYLLTGCYARQNLPKTCFSGVCVYFGFTLSYWSQYNYINYDSLCQYTSVFQQRLEHYCWIQDILCFSQMKKSGTIKKEGKKLNSTNALNILFPFTKDIHMTFAL